MMTREELFELRKQAILQCDATHSHIWVEIDNREDVHQKTFECPFCGDTNRYTSVPDSSLIPFELWIKDRKHGNPKILMPEERRLYGPQEMDQIKEALVRYKKREVALSNEDLFRLLRLEFGLTEKEKEEVKRFEIECFVRFLNPNITNEELISYIDTGLSHEDYFGALFERKCNELGFDPREPKGYEKILYNKKKSG